MDDVAARAGITKPTVYAHFRSKEELFSAVIDLIRGLYLGRLQSPEAYAAEPVEAITLFCSRFLDLMCWRDAVGYQRVTLAAAARSPAIARAVHDALYGEACRSLAAYLRARVLTTRPEQDAEFFLAATSGATLIRHLYGVDEPSSELPEDCGSGVGSGRERIREIVLLIASRWGK